MSSPTCEKEATLLEGDLQPEEMNRKRTMSFLNSNEVQPLYNPNSNSHHSYGEMDYSALFGSSATSSRQVMPTCSQFDFPSYSQNVESPQFSQMSHCMTLAGDNSHDFNSTCDYTHETALLSSLNRVLHFDSQHSELGNISRGASLYATPHSLIQEDEHSAIKPTTLQSDSQLDQPFTRSNTVKSSGSFSIPRPPVATGKSKAENVAPTPFASIKNSAGYLSKSGMEGYTKRARIVSDRKSIGGSSSQAKDDSNNGEERMVELEAPYRNPFLHRDVDPLEIFFDRESRAADTQKFGAFARPFQPIPRRISDFVQLGEMGSSQFADVYAVRHRLDGRLYALKCLREKSTSRTHLLTQIREVCAYAALQDVRHLLQYYGSWNCEGHVFIQLELCPFGSLEDLISIGSRSRRWKHAPKSLEICLNPAHSGGRKSQEPEPSVTEANFGTQLSAPSLSVIPCTPSDMDENSQFDSVKKTSEIFGISESVAWIILSVISETLKDMHARGMVHMDIRPSNVFLQAAPLEQRLLHKFPSHSPEKTSLFSQVVNGASTAANFASTSSSTRHTAQSSSINPTALREELENAIRDGLLVLRVGDLGHCVNVDTDRVDEGENRYCARELINEVVGKIDLRAADIFSLGASVYELCLGRVLGSTSTQTTEEWHNIRDGHLDPKFQSNYSQELFSLVSNCMDGIPANRPTAEDVIHACRAHQKSSAHSSPSDAEIIAQLRAENLALRKQLSC